MSPRSASSSTATRRSKRRRVRESKPRRSYLDTAAQITALLDAAAAIDAGSRADRQHIHRRDLLAVLVFGGLRIGELLALRWGDVDLAAGRLRVGHAKTDAGRRDVTLRPVLRDVLAALRPERRTLAPGRSCFPRRAGSRRPPQTSAAACSRRP